jgi:hypothetical protein
MKTEELEKQSSSFELSKKLKELLVKQESYFYWCEFNNEESKILPGIYEYLTYPEVLQKISESEFESNLSDAGESPDTGYGYGITENVINHFSAFTVAELGDMLPPEIEKRGHLYIIKHISYHLYEDGIKQPCWQLEYASHEDYFECEKPTIIDIKQADAYAKMLIYLIKNNLVSDEWKKEWLNI